jgi:hypothetical protein
MDIDPNLYNQCLMQYQQHQQTLALSMAPTTTISPSRILSSSVAPSTGGASIANNNNNDNSADVAAVEEGVIPSELLLSYLQTMASMNPSLLLLLSNSNLNTNVDSSSSSSTPFPPQPPPEATQQTQVPPLISTTMPSSSALESPNPQVSFQSSSSAPQTDQKQS